VKRSWVAAVGISLSACSGLWFDTYWRSERYVLVAIDAVGQMNLAFETDSGLAQRLVGPTVFAVGADERYIVVKQHPSKDPFGGSWDRSVTNFYVVERTSSMNSAERTKRVRGPMTKADFEALQESARLPRFSTVIGELE
jgi:hypothetical protein